MVKVKIIGSVILTLSVILLIGIAEKRFALPQSVSSGILMLLTMVLTYPIVEWWYGKQSRKITFKRWTLAAVVASITATLIRTALVSIIGAS